MTFDVGVRLALDALNSDGAALTAAAGAAEDALGMQREALDVLAEGWRGVSGSGAADFVARNCEAAAEIVTALRDAAGVLSMLSEDLGYLVDMKAEAAMRGDVHDDAFPAMDPAVDPATDSVAAAYGDAATRLGEIPGSGFETPVAGFAPPTSPPMSGFASPTSFAPPTSGFASPTLPNLGGGLTALIAQIAEALGPYADLDSEVDAEPEVDPESEVDPEPEVDAESEVDPEPVVDPKPAVVPEPVVVPEPAAIPEPAAVPEPVVVPEPAALPAEADPEPLAVDDAATPCEIAADELAQVGQ